MITVEDRGDELYVVDGVKNETTIGVSDWERGGTPMEIDRRVDETIAGRASELRFSIGAVSIETVGEEQWKCIGTETGTYNVETGTHLLQFDTHVTTLVKFQGAASMHYADDDEEFVVEFRDTVRALTIGFRGRIRKPENEITVPPTPEGVAQGLTYLASAIETTTPDSSYPTLRGYPPLLTFGESRSTPKKVRQKTVENGIEIHVPEDLATIFVVAPLAFYLQASIKIVENDRPHIVAPQVGFEEPLTSLPGLQFDVASKLRRVFYLDCLVRNVGPYGTEILEFSLLENLDIDAVHVYEAEPAERLVSYLDVAFEKIESELPEWHLSTFVQPEISYASALPHLLDRLSLIFLPEASRIDRGELIEESLNEAYRSAVDGRWNDTVRRVRPLKPAARPGRFHGWMADDATIDAFKLPPCALDNRFDYVSSNGGQKTITVVVNDPAMDGEQTTVEEIYRKRAEELTIELAIREELTIGELSDVFQRQTDFVHYIGHCDERGLRCADGNLAIEDIDESNARTFFLNACGSYHQGLELVEKGSVAGGVTIDRVLDQQATRVGITVARLIMHGFSIEKALQLARRRTVVSKGYICVGDGTYSISQNDDKVPVVKHVEYKGEENYKVTYGSLSPRVPGSVYQPYLPNRNIFLFGNRSTSEVSRSTLLNFLSRITDPVIYNNKYFWADELHEHLKEN